MSDDKDDKGKKGGDVINFPGTTSTTAAELSMEAVKNLENNLHVILEYQELTAKMYRNKYVLLTKQGFSEAQALELCKTIP